MRDNGYTCDGARDAEDARRAFTAATPTGSRCSTSTCRESRASICSRRSGGIIRTIAVVMVTGEDSTKLAMTAIELGAYGYLVKPVRIG